MNKLYASKETALIFHLIYNIGMEKESIENDDILESLFKSTLLEIDGRITGAELLLKENEIGAVIEPEIADEDEDSYNRLLCIVDEIEDGKLIFDENCKLLAEKRLKALETYYDAIDNLYKLFYNPNLKALKEMAEINGGVINGN